MNRKDLLRYIFWEWVEPIASALAIALIVMKFVMALYVIPTGSMQPTLHGKGDHYPKELGDKVVVNKFVYDFTQPERWDVIVFDYPFKTIICSRCDHSLDRKFPKTAEEIPPQGLICTKDSCRGKPLKVDFIEKEYIKRCVAIPGDEIRISMGDVLLKEGASWKPSIKTEEAQKALWISAFDPERPGDLQNGTDWWMGDALKFSNDGVVLSKDAAQGSSFAHTHALKGWGDKGLQGWKTHSGEKAALVGDVGFDFSVPQWPGSGSLELELSHNAVPHRLRLDFSSREYEVSVGDEALAKGAFPSGTGLTFARVDGHVQLLWSGDTQRWPLAEERSETVSMVPRVRSEGLGADLPFDHFRLVRDVYYINAPSSRYLGNGNKTFKVQPGQYFALGDNSWFSSDSRDWGPVSEEDLIGKAMVVFFPFNRMKFIE